MLQKWKTQVSALVNTVILQWKTPGLGRYVSYKEIVMYGTGGVGKEFIALFVAQIGLSAGSFLVGATIGIEPMHLQIMAVGATILGFGITVIRSYIIDNSKFKSGKFRPWLAWMAIPTLAVAIAFVWMPYETMTYLQKSATVFICYILLQCFSPFYTQAYGDLVNVISPNSTERTDIVSVSSIMWSMAPTLTGLIIPPLAQAYTGGLNNLATYRFIYPAFAAVGLAISYLAVVGTKERIVVAQSHVTQFKFMDAFRAVTKNKYFWITSLAGWLGFLEGSVGVILGWTFIYGYPDRMGTYSLAQTLIGNASLWAMIFCPFAIRSIGKRNLLIWCNIANILFIGALYPWFDSIPMLVVLSYLNGFVGAFAIVYNPGINADMRDYQQYYTGERIDGMFGAVGIIGSFIGMFTGMVVPMVYQKLGLENNYNVLEVASFRMDMFHTLIVAAVIGAALNCVPYLFYDLTEVKQRSIVKVLKIRALFEDYGNGILQDEALVEAIDILDEAQQLQGERAFVTTKDDMKAAKRACKDDPQNRNGSKEVLEETKQKYKSYLQQQKADAKQRLEQARATDSANRKQAMKQARHENRAQKKLGADIAVCDFVVNEMQKFNTPRGKAKLERASKLCEQGVDSLYQVNFHAMKAQAQALPNHTQEQREIRSDALAFARSCAACHKALHKYYAGGIVVPNPQDMSAAQALPESSLSERLKKKSAVRRLVTQQSNYNRAVKVWLDAKRLLTERENYSHLDEIRAVYDQAKERADAAFAVRKEEADRLKEERLAEIEQRKQERLEKKKKKPGEEETK